MSDRCNICGEEYRGLALDCACTTPEEFNLPPHRDPLDDLVDGFKNPYKDHEGHLVRPWITAWLVIALILSTTSAILYAYKYETRDTGGPLAPWVRYEALKQYNTDDGTWGEVIHQYEGMDCEAHRWRYRGIYYIGHVGFDCSALIREPTRR